MTRRKVPLINPGNEYGGNEAGIQLALIRGSVTEVNLADLDQCSDRPDRRRCVLAAELA